MSKLKIQNNTVVSAHYRGTLTESGEEFDSSWGKKAMTFLIGAKQMIPGFEAAIMGKESGDKFSFDLSPKEAYGERNPKAIQEVPLSQLPQGVKVGDRLTLQSPTGQAFLIKVSEVNGENATLDMNHQLAGESLSFEVEIISVREANEAERSQGMTMEQIAASQQLDCCTTGSCGS